MREFALIDGLEPLSLKSLIVTAAGFFFFVALLWIGSMLLPGRIEKGAVLPDGSRRSYRLNGLYLFLTVIVAAAMASVAGFSLAPLAKNVSAVFVVANVFAISLSSPIRPLRISCAGFTVASFVSCMCFPPPV